MTLDPRLLLLSPEDNCLIAATTLAAGTALELEGDTVVLADTIALGHKLARHAFAPGEKIVRYGAPIGHVTRAVAKGEHLHTHNLESDYLPTYTLDAGHAYVERDDS
ncbi:hydrolase [Trinickia dabaoshanensis]|uniref:Hydrolase n=1 Tax=Trinickia dabaoshanensis TaxID=564714 RepID=A0A2N7VC29_9BURK|nr:UxaA family hydrolase [Trinickia dabaoshanensis]PMS14706.1 hydrolase [Trinickia dabaoshanensis]